MYYSTTGTQRHLLFLMRYCASHEIAKRGHLCTFVRLKQFVGFVNTPSSDTLFWLEPCPLSRSWDIHISIKWIVLGEGLPVLTPDGSYGPDSRGAHVWRLSRTFTIALGKRTQRASLVKKFCIES